MSDHHDHDDDHHHSNTPPTVVPKVPHSTREQLDQMHIPQEMRDQCVDFLVVLNRCRATHGTNPFYCNHERHMYEQCEYELMMQQKDKYKGKSLQNPLP